ncbi:MAG: hypothetical protein IJ774_10665 [Selenomonadaceae bacterium]|nr:hypothetical protein [Selenomonadaceae bacterium]MBR1806828.1 hypothetical protein [Selenomonadaceae bacterium]
MVTFFGQAKKVTFKNSKLRTRRIEATNFDTLPTTLREDDFSLKLTAQSLKLISAAIVAEFVAAVKKRFFTTFFQRDRIRGDKPFNPGNASNLRED